jgi:tRNA threonylcarbamoyladenosine biosynthesis protein TsaE
MTHPVLTLDLAGEADTAVLGERLADIARPGDVIALYGDLGAGKTTLARALIRRLAGPETEAPSPTFPLVQTYQAASAASSLTIWHFDLYRLNDPGEARELGLEEAVDGLALIEWPERLGRDLPIARLEVQLSFGGAGRIARLLDLDNWSTRLNGDWRPTR